MELLKGVRVLDATKLLPGGFCTLLLADLGAEIICIEDRADVRQAQWGPLAEEGRGYYRTLHRNKKSVVVDLKRPQGREILLRLAAKTDVFLEGYRPKVKERLRISYTDLEAVNPRLIYCSISGYGQDGPYSDRAGHDINYVALAGVLAVTGEAGGPPVIPGVQVADIGAGAMYAAIGILAAVHARDRTGHGQYLDMAMLDGAVSWMSVHAAQYLALGRPLRRGKMLLSGAWAWYAIYRTGDGGYLSLGALEHKFWTNFCSALGLEELAGYQYVEDRQKEVRSRVQAVLLQKTRQEWVDFFSDKEVCCEPVLEIEEVLEHPQVRHRGLVLETEDAAGQVLRMPGTPFSAGPGASSPPPEIGEHTREVLTDLGYGEEELAGLEEEGIIHQAKV